MSDAEMKPDAEVAHAVHGRGNVLIDRGGTVVVRFAHGLEEVPRVELSADAGIGDDEVPPLTTLLRLMGESVRSVNDTWGVFSRSRIDLLPHQLWVCRQVNAQWPTHWLVADDVGLGKTIEAGLILLPLVSRGVARRVLILCPASLVEQWQYRLRTMFDLRFAVYTPEQDKPRSDYWGTHPFVVASLETIRIDRAGRRQRLLEADPWDMLIVDEAHRLNANEDRGATLGHQLVQELSDADKFTSMVFFTGTPHRGKDFGFLSLLSLLRPDLFNPREGFEAQVQQLRSVMIRNNKQDVTDLAGKRLFQSPRVESATYTYSTAETIFYDTLTDFISSGKAYASGLGDTDGRAVMLVLISMQKLASSSVAAIASALRNRLAGIGTGRRDLQSLRQQRDAIARLSASEFTDLHDNAQDGTAGDVLAELDERIGELDEKLRLVEDEEERLGLLIELADAVGPETKIERMIEELRDGGRFAGRSVLMFTEYKATQAKLLSRLAAEFGEDCFVFINGDNRLNHVVGTDGRSRTLRLPREEATRRFNTGAARFLVATEAGGEGIDLQERCHTLIHVDLPWNPMRLHQRVGRLNRYGQTRRVEVLTLRNPDTVESRIWDHLNIKLQRIQMAFSGAMDDPEDIMQLVLGMTSPNLFRELFSAAPRDADSLNRWFDDKTNRFGGEDAVDAVKRIVGHCARFNYGDIGGRLPRVDLVDLKPLMVASLSFWRRRVEVDDEGQMSFLTPDEWKREVGIKTRYDGLGFDRGGDAGSVAGIGHKLVDRILREVLDLPARSIAIPRALLKALLYVFRVRDRITTASVPAVVVGVIRSGNTFTLLADWQVLLQLNEIVLPEGRTAPTPAVMRSVTADQSPPPDVSHSEATGYLRQHLSDLGIGHEVPELTLLATLHPVG